MRLDHGERNVLRARSQQTEWTCIISLSLVQFASMSCNSADLHSCAFQDRLWMNKWRECWTDANFSGSARIEDRRVGRGGRQHLMLLRRFTLLFSPTLSTAETLSVLFALSSLASSLCRLPHSLLCASCHLLPGSNASTGCSKKASSQCQAGS